MADGVGTQRLFDGWGFIAKRNGGTTRGGGHGLAAAEGLLEPGENGLALRRLHFRALRGEIALAEKKAWMLAGLDGDEAGDIHWPALDRDGRRAFCGSESCAT